MDIKKLLALDLSTNTHRVAVEYDEAGEPKLGFIVVSTDSPQYKAEERKQRAEVHMERAKERGKKIDKESFEYADRVNEQMNDAVTRRALAVTVGWFGFTDGKKEAEFNPETAKELFNRFSSWKAAVLADADRSSNFLPK